MQTLAWPDTTHEDPPADHLYRSATWLLGRHPVLARLAERVPDVISRDPQYGLEIDLERLVLFLVQLDEARAAWEDYERRRPAPYDDSKYDAWVAAGPQKESAGAEALGVMSRTEVSRLRLLATFASSSPRRVPFLVADLSGFDDEGQELIRDWVRALLAA